MGLKALLQRTMRPHLNIGTIDHVKTTLTAAIVGSMADTKVEQPLFPPLEEFPNIPPHVFKPNPPVFEETPKSRRSRLSTILGATAMMGMYGGMMGMGGPSGAYIRFNPDREKTPEDLEKMEAARRKRELKAAKRNRHAQKDAT